MIGIIGCGNMGSAIIKGYYNKNNQMKFLTYDHTYDNAKKLADEVNGQVASTLGEISQADSIVIACKPQQLNTLVSDLAKANCDLSQKHIISILAATPITTLQQKLKASRVTRVMPNTPAMIGMGMSLVLHAAEVQQAEKELVNDFFSACGEVAQIPNEILFDQVTTVSGSGPAYVYLFAQTMAEKLVQWGVDAEQAKNIAIQLFRGSSELMHDQKDLSLDELIGKVTSKGGVTIEAVKSYRGNHLDQLTAKALDAAYERSEEIKRELN